MGGFDAFLTMVGQIMKARREHRSLRIGGFRGRGDVYMETMSYNVGSRPYTPNHQLLFIIKNYTANYYSSILHILSWSESLRCLGSSESDNPSKQTPFAFPYRIQRSKPRHTQPEVHPFSYSTTLAIYPPASFPRPTAWEFLKFRCVS